MKRLLLGFFICALAAPTLAGPSWLGGNIVNITSGAIGLMVMLDTGVPDNCVGTPYGWMLIPETAKTMIAVTLLAKLQNASVVVYTSGRDASGYCIVNQVDPSF